MGLAGFGQRLRDQGLSSTVVETLLDARAPSTRTQYDARWRQFSAWCGEQVPSVDPLQAQPGLVLSFLQSLLAKGRCFSTIKGMVAAITACQSGIVSPLSEHPLVKDFLKAAKRKSSTARPLLPPWDLGLVLDALCEPPFEPLDGLGLDVLTIKTVFLLAITTAKRVSDLHALSVHDECMSWSNGGRSVRLQSNPVFVSKTQRVASYARLEAFHPPPFSSDQDRRLHNICPLRALRLYVQRTKDIRGEVSQLFVTHGPGRAAGKAASKPTLSRWIVEAIRMAYSSRGVEPPTGLRAHSSRAQATSWALFKGVSLQEVCDAANWSSGLTFADFYSLDVAAPSLAQAVLGVADTAVSGVGSEARA